MSTIGTLVHVMVSQKLLISRLTKKRFVFRSHVKYDICGEMNPLDIFCIGESEFVFHLDGELNRGLEHRASRVDHKPKTSSGFTCQVIQQRIYDPAADTASLLDIRPIVVACTQFRTFGLVPIARYIHTPRNTIQNHRPTKSAKLHIDHHSSPAISHSTNSHHRPNPRQSSRSNLHSNFLKLHSTCFSFQETPPGYPVSWCQNCRWAGARFPSQWLDASIWCFPCKVAATWNQWTFSTGDGSELLSQVHGSHSSGNLDADNKLWQATSPRFWLQQKNKLRPIDNFSSSHVNSSVGLREKFVVDSVDEICAMVKTWMQMSGPGIRLVGKTYDMRKAYRQLAIHESHLDFAWISVWNPQTQAPALFRMETMPLGSTASGSIFLRISQAIKTIGIVYGGLVCRHSIRRFCVHLQAWNGNPNGSHGPSLVSLSWLGAFRRCGERSPILRKIPSVGCWIWLEQCMQWKLHSWKHWGTENWAEKEDQQYFGWWHDGAYSCWVAPCTFTLCRCADLWQVLEVGLAQNRPSGSQNQAWTTA